VTVTGEFFHYKIGGGAIKKARHKKLEVAKKLDLC
jgi:hypothetical protein